MEHLKPWLDLAHQFLPADLWNKGVLAAGYLSIFGQIVPWMLVNGPPAAVRAADAVSRFLLATPLRPLILYFAPSIVKFLDSFTAALEKIADTFKTRLEADLAAAAAPPAPAFAEGQVRKGGLNEAPSMPRPDVAPAMQKPAP